MTFWFWVYFTVLVIFSVLIFLIGLEHLVYAAFGVSPPLPSGKKLADAVVQQIAVDCPGAKTIVDIGSGWGTMVLNVAKEFPNATVIGLEIMPTPFICSCIQGRSIKNATFRLGNAFKFLQKKEHRFDVGITYLIPHEMKEVDKFLSQFKILIVLDFPIPARTPYKKVKLHHGPRAQHWLYVYKK